MSEEELSRIGQDVRDTYARNKRVMAFDEFYALFLQRPEQYARTSAQYLKAVFEHFGAVEGDEAARAQRGMEELEIEGSIRPRRRRRGALRLDARPNAQEREENHKTDPSNDTHGVSERS